MSDEEVRERAVYWETLASNEPVSPIRAEYQKRAESERERLELRALARAIKDDLACVGVFDDADDAEAEACRANLMDALEAWEAGND